MNVSEALQSRRSVRRFTADAVSGEDINTLMHAAMSGPSACNARPWDFWCVTSEEKLALLRKASRFSNMQAPLAVVVCGNLKKALPMGMADYWIQDCSAAIENILLQAVELGLGAVWCGLHPQKGAVTRTREALDLPESIVPLGLLWIGHPAESPAPRDQYDEKRVHYV